MQGGWNFSRKLIKTYPYWLQKLADCFGFVEKLESEEKKSRRGKGRGGGRAHNLCILSAQIVGQYLSKHVWIKSISGKKEHLQV